jgi:hypothetical protein
LPLRVGNTTVHRSLPCSSVRPSDTLIDEMDLTGENPSEACRVFLNAAFLGSLLHWVKNGNPAELDAFRDSMMTYAVAVVKAGSRR